MKKRHSLTRRDIVKTIRRFIALSKGNYVNLYENPSLRSDLGFDSLDQLALIVMLEKFFNVEIPDHLFGEIHFVSDIEDAFLNELNIQVV